jgi:hypothetical protein
VIAVLVISGDHLMTRWDEDNKGDLAPDVVEVRSDLAAEDRNPSETKEI